LALFKNRETSALKYLPVKGDISIRAKIEPDTFAVKIFDDFNN